MQARWVIPLVGLMLVGCTAQEDPDQLARRRLNQIGQAYGLGAFFVGHRTRCEDDVRETLRTMIIQPEPKDRDAIMISPRDGEPFVIIYGEGVADVLDMQHPNAKNIIMAYERTGLEGKRYVLMSAQNVEVLTDDDFSRATFANKHKPAGRK